jgi:hypothetical protein
MKRTKIIIAAVLALVASVASAQTIVPLNTGYDHNVYAPYTAVTTPVSSALDNYWINIASYPDTTSAIARAFVLQQPTFWNNALAQSHWISGNNEATSLPGVNTDNPGYTIYRKCFCLMPNYTDPRVSFQAQSDDTLQVWFNSHLNTMVTPQFGRFNTNPIVSLPSNPAWFHVGLNCIYALVEDTYGGAAGFNLSGTIQANGLALQPAFGPNQTFRCPCENTTGGIPTTDSASSDDSEVVAALIDLAEQRRTTRAVFPRRRR